MEQSGRESEDKLWLLCVYMCDLLIIDTVDMVKEH